jgi:hypothetical protein
MTASLRQAAQMALDALDKCFPHLPTAEFESSDYAAHVLRAALAVPDEPVPPDVIDYVKGIYDFLESTAPAGFALEAFRLPPTASRAQTALFDGVSGRGRAQCAELVRRDMGDRPAHCQSVAAPVERQPLTKDEIVEVGRSVGHHVGAYDKGVEFARAIEAKHGIKGAA